MTFANASLRAFLFFSFTFFLLPVIGNAQTPAPATPAEQAEAAACFQNLLDAIIAKDGARAARYVDQATFDRLHRLKLLALEGKPSEIKRLDILDQIRVFKMRFLFTAEQLTAIPEWQLFADDALIDIPITRVLKKFSLGAVTNDQVGLRGQFLIQNRQSRSKPFVRFSREWGVLKCETLWLERYANLYYLLGGVFYTPVIDEQSAVAIAKSFAGNLHPTSDPWQPLRRRR